MTRRVPLSTSALAACVLFALTGVAKTQQESPANRLIHSASPYLLQHAYNPVDWYPWGEEAIAKAKKENKLIFISVGYSTCYWCHVAERTIYSDPAIAALMNRWFVNIKIDREERPDLDQTYMLARQLLTGSGGWPNNVFLTPDLKPFFAGSYFPPEDREGVNGFPTILKLIHDDWKENPDTIREIGDQVQMAFSKVHDAGDKPASVSRIRPADWLAEARDQILAQRDREYGGIDGGGGTKFPQPPVIELLLTDYRVNNTTESLKAVTEMLEAMAFGGIHDHLGGGIHRYSTEPTWSVPHFEKMLYDNAQLIEVYTNYYAITRQPLARDIVADVVGYLARCLAAPGGGFYTAEDADIDGKEGETFLWTRAEITDAFGPADADRFFALYELTPLRSDPDGPGVLRIRRDQTSLEGKADVAAKIAELAPLRAKLLNIRNKRPQPARDDKIVVALNGLVITGLARAGKILDEPQWIASARRAGELLWRHAFDENTGRLHHHLFQGKAYGEGFLDDYAMLGLGYLALGEATGEPVWATRARALASALMDRFVKPDGLVVTSITDANLILSPIDLDDHETPSGTSAAYALLARLGKTDMRYRETATKVLARMADRIAAAPAGWASFTAYAALYGKPAATAEPQGTLDSAAHVKATAQVSSDANHDEIIVTLTIAPSYHVNANPASADFLIPTVVTVPSAPDARITYPEGRIFRPKFSPEGISVYEGSVAIKIALPEGRRVSSVDAQPLRIEVQACTAELCLPPATLDLNVRRECSLHFRKRVPDGQNAPVPC